MFCFSINVEAFGDLCKGHGTLGSMPPEALLEKHLPCRPEQDVFAMALIVLQIASKPPYKSRNMFFNKVSAVMLTYTRRVDKMEGTYSYVICVSCLAMNYASYSGRSTVPIPTRDTSRRPLLYINKSLAYPVPSRVRRV